MSPALRIGYARVSTFEQDITVQRVQLQNLGVERSRIYIDHGYTGRNLERPGLAAALAACRADDILIVTKLDRLARSLPDANNIAQRLAREGVALQIGTAVYDPTDPVGKLIFNMLAMIAEFESDLISARTRDGLAIARTKGRLKGKPPKLSPLQQAELFRHVDNGTMTQTELAELFGVSRTTIHRTLKRRLTAKQPVVDPHEGEEQVFTHKAPPADDQGQDSAER